MLNKWKFDRVLIIFDDSKEGAGVVEGEGAFSLKSIAIDSNVALHIDPSVCNQVGANLKVVHEILSGDEADQSLPVLQSDRKWWGKLGMKGNRGVSAGGE